MSRYFFALLGITVIISVTACTSGTKDDIYDHTVIEIPSPQQLSFFDELIDDCVGINLELTDNMNSAIAYATYVRVYDGKIYVVDPYIGRKVCVFDTSGKFIRNIGSRGRASHEYIEPCSFELDYVNKSIIVGDRNGRKMLKFDLDGNYISTSTVPVRIERIAPLGNGQLVYDTPRATTETFGNYRVAKYGAVIADENGTFARAELEDITSDAHGLLIYNNLNSSLDGKVTYAPYYHDIIYEISYDDVIPKYRLKSYNKNKHLDYASIMKLSHEEFSTITETGEYTFFTGNHVDTPDYILIKMGFGNESISYFYSKRSNLCKGINSPVFKHVKTYADGYFWSEISLSDILILKEDMADLPEKLRKVIESYDEEGGNPMLIKFRLKDF
jgi:hypothetical protein